MRKKITLQEVMNDWYTTNHYGKSRQSRSPEKRPGCYVVVVSPKIYFPEISEIGLHYEVAYVGMSNNLNRRLKGHEVPNILRPYFLINIYFQYFDDPANVELDLIRWLKPSING